MSDPFRSGGFGSIGFGPFQNGPTDFGRYNIASDGDAVAATKKYSAQIAWANGTITDDAYLAALREYLNQTDKGSRERVSAQNEYDDAVYTIGRNKLVRGVNNATTTATRVAALRRLIGYDRRKLGTMKRDNEQYREMVDRISDAEAQIRSVRYSDLVRKFNAGTIGIGPLLEFAQGAALAARGAPDMQEWQDRVREWKDRQVTERINQLYQDYDMERIPGSTVIEALKGRLAGLSQDSPQYAETQRAIEDMAKRVQAKEIADQDDDWARRLQNGTATNAEYLRYLQRRVDFFPKGSSDRRSARDAFLQASYEFGEAELIRQVDAGDAQASDLVDFYRGYQGSMLPGSQKYLDIQTKITNLLIEGAPALGIGDGVGGYLPGAGRWVSLTGAPGGTPVNAQGYASQFDGSAFGSSNCGMASAAMMAWAVSGGKIRVSGGDLRYYSGDRDQRGDERGTTYDDITLAFQHIGLGLEQKHGMGFNAWKRRLMQGEGSLISGHYMDAPANLRLTNGFDFTHTMYVDRAKRMQDGKVWFFVMDPLGRGGYSGQWWPEEAIKQYGWSGRANAGGGEWFGDVAFATKKGRSSSYINPDRDPTPYQAFDTDAEGRSTIGKGGGTNRQEAGPRQDWSKGRAAAAPEAWPQWQLPSDKKDGVRGNDRPKGVTDDQVTEFLAAVDAVAAPRLSDPSSWGVQPPVDEGDPDARRARAKALLGEWQGDARLAAVAWFTGAADPDAKGWNGTQRFYANAVGTRLGYEPVPKGGSLTVQTPPAYEGQVTSGARPGFQQGRALEGVPEETAKIGRMLLDELGVAATPDMIRAVVAWIATSGDKVVGNNPGLLRTVGQSDLPGQVAKDAQSGAVFESLQDGIAAWADEIRRGAPQILAGARTGDPERFLTSIDRSGWVQGGYGGALVRTFNEMPGEPGRVIIGGSPRVLSGSFDMASLARSEPSIAELFEVDPRDPVQMGWLDANIEAARDAFKAGASSWGFTTPGGQVVEMEFAPGMMGEITGIKASYLDWEVANAPDNETRQAAAKKAAAAWDDHNGVVSDMAYDGWKAQTDALDKVRQAALGSLDYATYLNATLQMADATKRYLGIDPAGPLDPDASWRVGQLKADGVWDDVIRMGDSLDARVTDDIERYNPTGDKVLGLIQKGYLVPQVDPQRGVVVAVTPSADVAYVEWKKDGTLGLVTIEDRPEMFEQGMAPTVTAGGDVIPPPRYVQENVVVTMGGASGYVPLETGKIRGVVLTSSGYRRTVLPPAADATRSYTVGPGRGIGSTAGRFIQRSPAGTSLVGRAPQGPRIIDVTTPQDLMVSTPGGMIDVTKVSQVNPFTNRLETWFSIPGSNVWVGGDTDITQKNPPTLVFGEKVSIKGGKLYVGADEYDPTKHGELSSLVHWYGEEVRDGAAPGEFGAPGSHHRKRQGKMTPGGGVAFDIAPPDPATAYLEGDIPFSALLPGGTPSARRPDPAHPGKDELGPSLPGVQPSSLGYREAAVDALRSRPRATADTAAGVRSVVGQFDPSSPISPDQLAAIATMDLGPMNAGAVRAPAISGRPSGLLNIGEQLAASVRTSAAAATAAAEAARMRAAMERRQAEMERRAAEAARRAAIAKTASTVDWSKVQATVAKPKPKPESMGYDPVRTPPPVGAPKIPKPKPPSTPQSQGMY